MNGEIAPTPVGVETLDPLDRLQRSRARLRAALLPAPVAAEGADAARPGPLTLRLRRHWLRWRRQWAASPVADLALAGVQSWWASQPWRVVAETVGDELHAAVVPIVRKHPVASLGVAVAAGAAVAWARPWRWHPLRGQVGAVVRQVGRSLGQQLGQWPLQGLLSAVLASWIVARPTTPAEAAPGEGTPVEPAPAP